MFDISFSMVQRFHFHLHNASSAEKDSSEVQLIKAIAQKPAAGAFMCHMNFTTFNNLCNHNVQQTSPHKFLSERKNEFIQLLHLLFGLFVNFSHELLPALAENGSQVVMRFSFHSK